jgi:hypothetical protein
MELSAGMQPNFTPALASAGSNTCARHKPSGPPAHHSEFGDCDWNNTSKYAKSERVSDAQPHSSMAESSSHADRIVAPQVRAPVTGMPDRGNGKVLQFSTEQSIQREQKLAGNATK